MSPSILAKHPWCSLHPFVGPYLCPFVSLLHHSGNFPASNAIQADRYRRRSSRLFSLFRTKFSNVLIHLDSRRPLSLFRCASEYIACSVVCYNSAQIITFMLIMISSIRTSRAGHCLLLTIATHSIKTHLKFCIRHQIMYTDNYFYYPTSNKLVKV